LRAAFIEAVLAGVEAGVIRVDGELRITIANASAKALLDFGVAEGDVDAEDPSLHDVAPDIAPAATRALESNQPVDLSIRRTGREAAMHLHVRVAPEADGAGAVITFHNTTRLVMGQRQAAWRDVARRIAHEIRNPLTPIQLSAERLRRRFSSQITTDRETFDRCTETITRQVDNIGRMVEEFSGFARMPKPTFGDFGLVDMVQSVAFAQRMATPGMAIHVNVDPSVREAPTLTMHGDERMLAQAFTNLLKNAAEAVERNIEAGGVKSGQIIIDITGDDEEVEIAVRDNGPGFPTANRDRVLEPYVTTRKNGVGLGLAIVVRIIEDHGGRLWLGDSGLEAGGAKVSVRMPLRPELSEDHVEYAEEGVA
jgi:two-component system nitrogen regulation sensor histidine kinase NtrY